MGSVDAGWQFSSPVRIHAGRGLVDAVEQWIPAGRTLLITSPGFTRRGLVDRLIATLGCRDVVVFDRVLPNPQVDGLDEATLQFRGEATSSLVALGGGSVLDTAKVLSLTLAGPTERPLHQVFRAETSIQWTAAIPVVAIPTTAGTGAEVTPFATVWDRTTGRKHSLAHELMHPRHAVLDPELTLSLPRDETLYGGLDTISHALESLWNRSRTPVSQILSLRALELATGSLEGALALPGDVESREAMQLASLLAGMAISQTRTAVAHAISYPLTARYGVPHGLACAFTLGAIIAAVDEHRACRPFRAQMLRANALLKRLNLPAEMAQRVSRQQVFAVIDEMVAPGRSENFVTDLTRDDLETIVSTSLDPA